MRQVEFRLLPTGQVETWNKSIRKSTKKTRHDESSHVTQLLSPIKSTEIIYSVDDKGT